MSAFEDFIQVELPRRPWVVDDPDQETVPVRRGAGPRQLEFIPLNEGQVVGKLAGTIQGIDIAGIGLKTYVHPQPVPLFAWYVEHNLDSEDYVVFVVDDSGMQIFPDSITAVDENIIEIGFNTQQTGKAVVIFA